MSTKESLIETLHESREHAREGWSLDGVLCNCRESIEALWPMIDSLIDQAYIEGVGDGRG